VSVAFDTLKFARALRDKAHLPAEQAESIAEAFGEATGEQLATKADLRELGADIRAEIATVKADVLLLKWMSGFTLALLVAVFAKLFMH